MSTAVGEPALNGPASRDPLPSVSVIVYSTGPSCVRCALTCRRLHERGIPFTVVDLSEEATDDAREYVTEDLGYADAPVVVVGDHPEHHWSGFRPDLIDRLSAWPALAIIPPAPSGRTLT